LFHRVTHTRVHNVHPPVFVVTRMDNSELAMGVHIHALQLLRPFAVAIAQTKLLSQVNENTFVYWNEYILINKQTQCVFYINEGQDSLSDRLQSRSREFCMFVTVMRRYVDRTSIGDIWAIRIGRLIVCR